MGHVRRDAVAESLRDRIVGGLHVGRLAGGDRLPPTRVLASEFQVNERVVLAALRTLADEGFVELRPRSGAYVVPPHPTSGSTLPDLGNWLVTMLLQARARGLPPREVSEYVRRCLETRRIRAACIECNRDQLHLLCSELRRDHGYVTEAAEVRELSAEEPPLAIRRADVLVTTLFHVKTVQRAATRLDKPWIAVALRREIMRELARRLREGPVYYVATDPRFERKLRRMLESMAPLKNLRVMIVGRDDIDAIPLDAPTFVMASASEQLATRRAGVDKRRLTIQPPRSLSDEAARDLLTFVVRANMAAFAAGLP